MHKLKTKTYHDKLGLRCIHPCIQLKCPSNISIRALEYNIFNFELSKWALNQNIVIKGQPYPKRFRIHRRTKEKKRKDEKKREKGKMRRNRKRKDEKKQKRKDEKKQKKEG